MITNESYGVNEDGKPEKVRDKQLQDLSDKAASMQEGRKEHAYIANNNNKATRFQQMTSYGRAHIEKENKERFLSDLFYQHGQGYENLSTAKIRAVFNAKRFLGLNVHMCLQLFNRLKGVIAKKNTERF